MANLKQRHSDNAPGNWYTDEECIACGLCESVAPSVFSLSKDGSHFLVERQPNSAKEMADAEDARDRCPVEAIGNDGPV